MTESTHAVREEPADVRSSRLALARAEGLERDAQRLADQHRAEHMALLLRRAYPAHSLAVFARYWDEELPRLIQVLSDGAEDVELQGDHLFRSQSPEQQACLLECNALVQRMGDDDRVLEALLPGESDHEGWTEFQLVLR